MVRIDVEESHDVAASVEAIGGSAEGARDINCCVLAFAEQKSMDILRLTWQWRDSAVIAHDVAASVESSIGSVNRGLNSAGEINRREPQLRRDWRKRNSLKGAGDITRREFALAEQKEMGPTFGTDIA